MRNRGSGRRATRRPGHQGTGVVLPLAQATRRAVNLRLTACLRVSIRRCSAAVVLTLTGCVRVSLRGRSAASDSDRRGLAFAVAQAGQQPLIFLDGVATRIFHMQAALVVNFSGKVAQRFTHAMILAHEP